MWGRIPWRRGNVGPLVGPCSVNMHLCIWTRLRRTSNPPPPFPASLSHSTTNSPRVPSNADGLCRARSFSAPESTPNRVEKKILTPRSRLTSVANDIIPPIRKSLWSRTILWKILTICIHTPRQKVDSVPLRRAKSFKNCRDIWPMVLASKRYRPRSCGRFKTAWNFPI